MFNSHKCRVTSCVISSAIPEAFQIPGKRSEDARLASTPHKMTSCGCYWWCHRGNGLQWAFRIWEEACAKEVAVPHDQSSQSWTTMLGRIRSNESTNGRQNLSPELQPHISWGHCTLHLSIPKTDVIISPRPSSPDLLDHLQFQPLSTSMSTPLSLSELRPQSRTQFRRVIFKFINV